MIMVFYIAGIQRRLDLNLVLERIQRHLWVVFLVSQSKKLLCLQCVKTLTPPLVLLPPCKPWLQFSALYTEYFVVVFYCMLHCIVYYSYTDWMFSCAIIPFYCDTDTVLTPTTARLLSAPDAPCLDFSQSLHLKHHHHHHYHTTTLFPIF